MWDIIIYPFSKVNGAAVEFWEWINNFIQHFSGHAITYPYWFKVDPSQKKDSLLRLAAYLWWHLSSINDIQMI